MNAARRARIEFFATHAGWCTPPGRMMCAKSLADAEEWREQMELGPLSIEWVDEVDALYEGDSDPWIEERLADGRLVIVGCVVTMGEQIASLGGVVVSSVNDPYCRVIEAQLCSEVRA